MRATILSFDGSNGVLSANGVQRPFDLTRWKSDKPPVAGQSVEFILDGEQVVSVSLVDNVAIAQEKAGELANKGSAIAKATYAVAGRDVAVAYGIFAVLGLFADVVRNIPITLPGIVNGVSYANLEGGSFNGGFGLILVLLSILSIGVPVFWHHKAAPLAYCAPLLIVIIGYYNLYSGVSSIADFVGTFSSNAGSQVFSDVFHLITLWAWLTIAVALYLAVVGFRRYKANKIIPS
ncbi:hypothetical protein [Acidithiobacillus ferriphilus]|uniref:hypothetical protein n=1 Tax=Acidithiobacillus ferriphilus TaxID=1689834 RepID=UPI001C60C57A|nr:hypothetical protein [Acidithiobacillus ferriphilus]MEB8535135.1 hypothetical protein [Acidithiobacillus ferriphilus]